MKPLVLKISGINSFIDEQVINFYQLTELGLFGIFGPTGSGKSTILDAITLSLYGEISRSGKDLSGIINSHCDRGYVYYEFELGRKGDKKRYFVYRNFKKDKEGATRTHEVKLCDITDRENPIVLEEKVSGVNNGIIKIIGLKGNDFTRSVVLPQGNFNEFLQLSGRDKRDMLERIFALQEYGSHLSIKIRNYKKDMEESSRFIEGKLKVYEGISQEVYKKLLEERELLEDQYKRAEEKFKKIDEDFLFNKELYGLTKEYQVYREKEKTLIGQEDEIGEKKKEYDLGEKAKHIQPYIIQKKNLHDQFTKAEEELLKNTGALGEIEDKLNNITPLYNEAREKKEGEAPKLLVKKNKMEEGARKLERLENLQTSYQDLVKRAERSKLEIISIKEEHKMVKDQVKILVAKIKEDKNKLRDLQVSPIYRKNLYEGQGLEKEYKKTQDQVTELANNIKKQIDTLNPLRIEGEETKKRIQQLEKNKITLDEKSAKAEEGIKAIQERNMAAILAKDLLEGEGCPVCGSLHHPEKARLQHDEEIEGLEALREKLSQDLDKIKDLLEKENKELQEKVKSIGIKEGLIKQWEGDFQNLQKSLAAKKRTYLEKIKDLNIENIEEEIKNLDDKDRNLERSQKSIEKLEGRKEKLQEEIDKVQDNLNKKENQLVGIVQNKVGIKDQGIELKEELKNICGKKDPRNEINNIKDSIQSIEREYKKLKNDFESYSQEKIDLEKDQRGLKATLEQVQKSIIHNNRLLEGMIFESKFDNIQEVEKAFRTSEERESLKDEIKIYEESKLKIVENLKRLEKRMKGRSIGEKEWLDIQRQREEASKDLEKSHQALIEKNTLVKDVKKKLEELVKTLEEKKVIDHQMALLVELENLFKGNRFVEYISMGQLKYIAREASQELKKITRGRYALELDIEGNFIIRDDFNGGVRRGTKTLSGGETFLTSLALALALSSQIQLKGKSPLEFFFLDEGFGTLDSDLLETVMNSLEKLHSDRLSVGLISHVEELKQRIPRKLIINPPEPGVSGTIIGLEKS